MNMTSDGWDIHADHHSPFVRTFRAIPSEPIDVEFRTPTVVAGRVTDGTYIGRVAHVSIRHQWEEKESYWWSQGHLHIYLVNPNTGVRYRTGWKAETIYPNRADDGVPNSADIIKPMVEATRPRTTIRVIEEEQS